MSGNHTFDPEVACEVGVIPAILYQNLVFWTAKNAANGDAKRHFHDGRWWTFNSVRAWALLFPYLSPDQIRRGLEKLEAAGLIATGHFGKEAYGHAHAFNRAKWYSPLRNDDLARMPNGSGEDAESYTDITTDITTNSKHDSLSAKPTMELQEAIPSKPEQPSLKLVASNPPKPTKPTKKQLEECFEERFWPLYPKKKGHLGAKAKFVTAARKYTAKAIIAGLRRAVADWEAAGTEEQFIPYPTTWLNQGRWGDEHETSKPRENGPPPRQSADTCASIEDQIAAQQRWAAEEGAKRRARLAAAPAQQAGGW